MKIQRVLYSSHFKRSFKKLPREKQKLFEKRLVIFKKNPFDPRLKTHKLSGKSIKYWTFRLTYSDRVVFEFISEEEIGLIDIGSHDVYQ